MYTPHVHKVKRIAYTLPMNRDDASGESRPRSASDRAYQWISGAILTGVFTEGQFLDEVELSRAVGTSRTPVREALHRLQAERYIDILPRRGAQVRIISARELDEIYATRFVIESHAFGEIVSQGQPLPEQATAIAEDLMTAGREQRWNDVAQYDQRLHSLLVAQAGNGVMSQLYDSLQPRQVRLAVRTVTTAPERLDIIHAEHLDMIEHLSAGHLDGAIATLRKHLDRIPSLMRTFSS